jgi:hypothetical protein
MEMRNLSLARLDYRKVALNPQFEKELIEKLLEKKLFDEVVEGNSTIYVHYQTFVEHSGVFRFNDMSTRDRRIRTISSLLTIILIFVCLKKPCIGITMTSLIE